MTEVERIVEQLRLSFEGEAWAGPSVLEALAGVTAELAAQRAFRSAHTIWELTLHLAANEGLVLDRLRGSRFASPSATGLWLPQPKSTEAAWNAALRNLEEGHLALRKTIGELKDAQLWESVPTRDHTWYDELQGTVQHNFYHAGQIVLLKKALQ